MKEFTDSQLEPSERRHFREVAYIVTGNGKPGMNSRLRRMEWVLYIIGGFLLLQMIQGTIRIVPIEPPTIQSTLND